MAGWLDGWKALRIFGKERELNDSVGSTTRIHVQIENPAMFSWRSTIHLESEGGFSWIMEREFESRFAQCTNKAKPNDTP